MISLVALKIKLKQLELGQSCFYIGTILLASTNLFAGFFYLISLVISFTKKNKFIKKDIWNISLIICSLFFILSAINISISQSSNSLYLPLKEYSWTPSAVWLNLFNWLPLFLVFAGFQIYLSDEIKRKRFAICLFIGTIPVIISMFLQKFNIHGPFVYLNGLLVFYLKELEPSQGLAGLFNNSNYAGLWLSATLPFSFFVIRSYRFQKIKYSFILSILISTIYCIISTNSRNSFLGVLITSSFMLGFKSVMIFFIFTGLLYFLFLELLTLPFLGSIEISQFLPNTLINKLLQTNYLNKFHFSRIDIWSQAAILISKRPFLGWGAGTFPILYTLSEGLEKAQHTHNMPLEIAQTHGIPIAFILILFVSCLFFKAGRTFFITNKYNKESINKAWIISFFVIVINHLGDVTYYDGRVSLLIWILLAGLKCIVDENSLRNKINNQT